MNPASPQSPDVSVVVPVFNEADNIARLIPALQELFESLDITWEAVIVDDGSGDDTWQQLENLANRFEQLSILRFTRNFGKEAALFAGLVHARAPATLVMDADFQHPPELIRQMWAAWSEGTVDIVSAVKSRRQKESAARGLGVKVFYWLFRKSAGIDLASSTDFKLISRRVRDAYLSLPEKHRFFRGLTSWLGFPETTVPFEPPERSGSAPSRWSSSGLYRYAIRSLISFSTLPIRILGWLGVATLLFALVLGAQTLFMKFTGQATEGFTTVILVILLVGSILMMGLAIIGAYVDETYQQVRKRPPYVIRESRPGRTER